MTVLEPDGVEIVNIDDGAITIGRSWRYGDTPIDELIDTAEEIDRHPLVLLEHIVAYKQIADRPKDRAHLAVIAERLSNKRPRARNPALPIGRLTGRTHTMRN